MPETDEEVPAPEMAPENDVHPADHELAPPAAPPETRFQRFLRLSLRWLAGILVVFVLGFLAALLLLYRPETQEVLRLRDDLQESNQRVAQLEDEVARLEALRTENEALTGELEATNLHLQILRALVDVNAARAALAKDEPARARLHLANTPDTLQELERMVEQDQRGVVTAMRSRLELALDEMERDTFAADSDLGVIAMNLEQLENRYFTQP